MQNVAKLYHLKMVSDENLTITVGFQRNDYFKNVNLLILFFSQ